MSDSELDTLESRTQTEFAKIAEKGGCEIAFDRIWESESVQFDRTCVECVRAAANDVVGEAGYKDMTSGAGHDSVYTSKVCPTSMIFVPCRDGISHNPAEYASPEDCAAGAQVLLQAVLRYDELWKDRLGGQQADLSK